MMLNGSLVSILMKSDKILFNNNCVQIIKFGYSLDMTIATLKFIKNDKFIV